MKKSKRQKRKAESSKRGREGRHPNPVPESSPELEESYQKERLGEQGEREPEPVDEIIGSERVPPEADTEGAETIEESKIQK